MHSSINFFNNCHKFGRAVVLMTSLTFLVLLVQYQRHHQQSPFRTYLRPQRVTVTKYLLNNLVCSTSGIDHEEIRIIILITSHPGDVRLRNKIREMVPTRALKSMKMRRLFLLGRLPLLPWEVGEGVKKYRWVSFQDVEQESKKHEDILVGDFFESYHNLTHKHLMGLQWVDRFCASANFVLKQDDDIIVDYFQLDKLLTQPPFSNLTDGNYILGKVLSEQGVIRDPGSKWFVPRTEYEMNTFPPFVSGWAYITTPKIVKAIVTVAQRIKFFWIDDVHVTGTLREVAGVRLLDLTEYFTTFKGQLQCCVASPRKSGITKTAGLVYPFWCDFLVGSPNDDLRLMELFYAHSKFCHMAKFCRRREGRKKLEHSCIITPDMVVSTFDGGGTNISSIGSWQPLLATMKRIN